MQADETTGSPLLGRVASDRPTPQQALWQDLELGMFVHFGLVAVTGQFTGITWFADGANPLYCSTLEPVAPGIFDPTDFDAKQWVATARAGGARYLLFTAKHHDGFCLWPTATTPHSVQASPWRGGRGDLVGELAEACRQAGLRCEPPLWRRSRDHVVTWYVNDQQSIRCRQYRAQQSPYNWPGYT